MVRVPVLVGYEPWANAGARGWYQSVPIRRYSVWRGAAGGWPYHLPDAFGGVRQLANNEGALTLASTHELFDETLTTSGYAVLRERSLG